jgi:hypothetical protein
MVVENVRPSNASSPLMSDHTDGKRRRWLRWLSIVAIALAVYPLSIGPVAAIIDHSSGHRKTILHSELFRIYRPLFYLASRPAFGKPLAGYLNLCVRRAYRPYAEYDEGIATIVFTTGDSPPTGGCTHPW